MCLLQRITQRLYLHRRLGHHSACDEESHEEPKYHVVDFLSSSILYLFSTDWKIVFASCDYTMTLPARKMKKTTENPKYHKAIIPRSSTLYFFSNDWRIEFTSPDYTMTQPAQRVMMKKAMKNPKSHKAMIVRSSIIISFLMIGRLCLLHLITQ